MSYSDLRKKYGLTSSTEATKVTSNEKAEDTGYSRLRKKYGIGETARETTASKWLTGVQNLGKSASSYYGSDGYVAPDTSYETKIDQYLSKVASVRKDVASNKSNYSDPDKALSSVDEAENYLKQLKENIQAANKHYAQFSDEKAYNAWKHDTNNATKFGAMSSTEIEAQRSKWKSSDKDIVHELMISNMPYSREYAQQDGKDMGLYDEVEQKRKYISEKYGITFTESSYENGKLLTDLYNTGKVDTTGGDVAYTTSSGQNVTWDKLYNDALQREDLDSLYAQYSQDQSWDGSSSAIDTAKKDREIVYDLINSAGYEASDVITGGALNNDQFAKIQADRDYISAKYGVDLSDIDTRSDTLIDLISNIGTFYRLNQLTDKEKAVLSRKYETEGSEAALEWHNSRMNIYDERARNAKTKEFVEYGQEHPWVSSALSVGLSLGSGLEYIGDTAKQIATGEKQYNEHSSWARALTSGASENFSWEISGWDAGKFIYNTTMSGVNSAAAMATGGKLGGIMLGLSAAAQGTNDALDRGLSNEDAFWSGLMSGIFECAFESISIGNFNSLKDIPSSSFKEIAKNIGKSMLVNASEETATEIANIAYDIIANGDLSQFETRVRQLIANGTDESEAKSTATWEYIGQVVEAGGSGALMGAGFGMLGNTGNAIRGVENAKRNSALAQGTMSAPGGVDALRDVSAKAAENASQGLKDKLAKRSDKVGTKATRRNVASLYSALNKAYAEQDKAEIMEHLRKGNLSEKAAGYIADALVSYQNGELLTDWQVDLLNNNMSDAGVMDAMAKVLANKDSGMAQRRAELDSIAKKASVGLVMSELDKQATKAEKAEVKKVKAEGFAQDESGNKYVVADEGKNINTKTNQAIGELKVQSVEKGRITFEADGQTVEAKDVSFTTDDAVLYAAISDLGSIVDADTANSLVDRFHKTKGMSSATYANGMAQAYRYGYYGFDFSELKNPFAAASKLSEDQQEVAFAMGRANRKTDVKKNREHWAKTKKVADLKKTGKGGVYFRSNDNRAMDFDEYIKSSNEALKDVQASAVESMKIMSKALGIQFFVYESYVKDGVRYYVDEKGKERKNAPNGFYTNGAVYIDLHAGNTGKGTMLFTLAHELTHYIKDKSPSKFNALADIVFRQSGMKGSVSAYVAQQMEKAKKNGSPISYADAVEETVADAMESILTSGRVVEMLAEVGQKDKSLKNTIVEWFKNTLSKLKDALKSYAGISPETNEGRAIAQSKELVTELEKVFAEGLVEARENAQKENTTDEGDMKMQARSVNGSQVVWIENSGFTNAQLQDPNTIAQYIASHIGEVYRIIESGQSVYIGKDLPGEFTHSKYTSYLQSKKPALLKAKNKAASSLGEMIEIATNRRWETTKHKAAKDAKYGMYRYDTKFAFPIRDQGGNVVTVRAYDAELLIRNASDGKKYLYDIVNIKENTANAIDLRHKEARKGSYKTATQGDASKNSIRNTEANVNKNSTRDSSPYSYGALTSKPDMTVTVVSSNVPQVRSDVVTLAKRNAARVGSFDTKTGSVSVRVDDIGRSVLLTTAGLRHGLDRRYNVNAVVTLKIGEILKNSIRINEMNPTKDGADGSYVLIGAAKSAHGRLYIVRSVVNTFSNEVTSVDVLYAVNAKTEFGSIKKENQAGDNPQGSRLENRFLTGSTISIAELLDYVNQYFPDVLPEDVLKHYGHEARPEGKLGEGTLYQHRDPDAISNRELLVDALSSVAITPEEKSRLQEYQNHSDLLDRFEAELYSINAQLRELSFAPGKRDMPKIRELKARAMKLTDYLNKGDATLLRLEATKPLQALLGRERKKVETKMKKRMDDALKAQRESAEAKLEKVRENNQESRKKALQNYKEASSKRELRIKIRKTIRDLNKLLTRGTKERNVKEGLKDFVSTAIASSEVLFIDIYTNEDMVRDGVGTELTEQESKYLNECTDIMAQLSNLPAYNGDYLAWQARRELEESLKSKLSYRMSKLKDVFARERQRLNKATVSSLLDALANEYAKLEDSNEAHIKGAYQENVYQYLRSLNEEIGGTIVKDMSVSQLESLHKAYTMVLTTVQNANKMFAKDLMQSKEEIANRVMKEVYQAGGEHGLWSKGQIARNQASWNNTKPIYAAERIGSPTFVKLVKGLFKGQYNWATDMNEAKMFRQKVANKYGFKDWDMEKTYKFTSSSGVEFELNLNQIMSLCAYAKREQAHDHLLKGGFVFGKNTEVVVTKNGIKKTYLNKSAKAHNISDEIMGEIVGKLSQEQKGFVEDMQEYLSTTMGAKGNEVSMRLYGVKLFTEKFYFPLRSAGQFKERAKEAELKQQQGQISIANFGFTKAITPKASNPVVLDGFTDVWAGHVNEMSLYHSMVLPMEDFRRVYNYSSPNVEGQESASVNSIIENAYGDAATGYFDQLYKELNGGAIIDPRENLSKKMIGKFKKSAVLLSNSVWVQQFSAIGRACALIEPKYFVGAKVDKKKRASLWAEMKQYAPVAIIKEMGGFDTHTGLSAKDYLLAGEYGKGERVKGFIKDKQYRDEIMGYLPALADELTWCAIWETVKRETNAKNPKLDVKSEEFLQKAGERFSEVIEKTQVYDSVLARSANMRSKQGLMQMLTSFLAEPTTTVNMVEDALRKGNKKVIARTFRAVAATIILNNALASIVYAMRDDDEDETFLEKYFQAFISGMLDDINPMTYYPILKDIWSLSQGYGVERTDMAIYSDIAEAINQVVALIAKYDSDMDADETAEYYWNVAGALMKLLDAGASAFGIPWKNVRRDLFSYYNTYKTFTRDGSTTWKSFADAIGGAALDSIPIVGLVAGKSNTDKLYDAIISGDTAYVNRLKGGYKDVDSYNNALRKALRENDPRVKQAAIAWNANDLDEAMRIAKDIVAEKHFILDDVFMAIRSEANSLESDDGNSDANKAKGLFTAEQFAEAIAQGDRTSANTAKADIIKTHQRNGKTREEAENSFESSAKRELKELFTAGRLSEQQVSNALKAYCDLDDEDAKKYVDNIVFEKEHPELDGRVTLSQYQRWEVYGKTRGVALDLFANVAEFRGDGTSNGVRSQDEVAQYIMSMTTDDSFRDALWCCFWKESTLKNAPWH